MFAEFQRTLAAGGYLLLAFQVGNDDLRHIEHAYGHGLSLDAYRLSSDNVIKLLADAGFGLQAQMVREPAEFETVPQAYLLARKAF